MRSHSIQHVVYIRSNTNIIITANQIPQVCSHGLDYLYILLTCSTALLTISLCCLSGLTVEKWKQHSMVNATQAMNVDNLIGKDA